MTQILPKLSARAFYDNGLLPANIEAPVGVIIEGANGQILAGPVSTIRPMDRDPKPGPVGLLILAPIDPQDPTSDWKLKLDDGLVPLTGIPGTLAINKEGKPVDKDGTVQTGLAGKFAILGTDGNFVPFREDKTSTVFGSNKNFRVYGPVHEPIAQSTGAPGITSAPSPTAPPAAGKLSAAPTPKVYPNDIIGLENGAPITTENGNPITTPAGEYILSRPVLGPDGQPSPPIYAQVLESYNPYCQALSPTTRLLIENAAVSATYQHSNQVGLTNVVATNPASTALTQSVDTYQVGVGYVNKPFLKQILASLPYIGDPDGRKDIARQGTVTEDFLLNAVTMNASLGYGRQIQLKNTTVTDSLITRPSYSASVTYQLDLERAYIHLFHWDSRPVDPGYYYRPGDSSFWPTTTDYNEYQPY